MRRTQLVLFLLLSFSLMSCLLYGQTTIKGVVTDAQSGDPVPLVNIFPVGHSQGTTSDFNGEYIFSTPDSITSIQYSLVGYLPVVKKVNPGKSQVINVKLNVDVKTLSEVTVQDKKNRYKNRNNPAVELIRQVIDHKKQNKKEELDAYQFEKYEKVQFALSNVSEKFKNKKYLKKFQFIFENIDTNKIPGKEVLPMYFSESIANVYYRKSPKKQKEIVRGTRKVEFKDYIDNESIEKFINYLYQDIDIYDNNIMMLTNQFVSPISDVGPIFYRYYILDTVMVDNTKCYKMSFYPRNKSDFQFQGNLYITFDSSFAVKKDEMTVSVELNLNFVKGLNIVQEFNEVKPGQWMITKDEISVDFGIAKKGMGIYGQRSASNKNYIIGNPMTDDFYKGEPKIVVDTSLLNQDRFWDQSRHAPLSKSEQGVITMVDSIQSIPEFKRFMKLLDFLIVGYIGIGKVEIGPVNTSYSYNPIEGSRVRFGGRTTHKFSQRVNYDAYAAYGFKDDKWKYSLSTTYALGKSSYDRWPLKNLKLSYQYDIKIPGQELQFINEDNLLLSIKRGENTKMTYNRALNLEYLHELVNNFSYNISLQHLNQAPTGTLYFNPVSYYGSENTRVSSITTSEINISLRYAPSEQFFQGRVYRTQTNNEYPIYQLRINLGVKDLFGGEYSYQKITAGIFKRIYLSPFGYTDILVEGGQLFGKVPYPLIYIHRANQTYSLQLQSYNLMNFLEFVSDRYIALNINHFFNGFFFNSIPVFKQLKLREVVTAKLLYGTLSNTNNPEMQGDLFKLPVEEDGTPLTYSLDEKPYIEISAGIANIFKLLRVDVIKRFSYLDHPNVSEYGVRARFKLDF